MKRLTVSPRTDWQHRVESHGMTFHTLDGEPYWDETACYEFTAREIDALEAATQALHDMCLAAVEWVIDRKMLGVFALPAPFVDWVAHSWETDEHTIYGRFDFSFDGQGPPKLLEFNADTPTALLEAAVVQWFWLKDVHPDADQFNSIHERLLEVWSQRKPELPARVHFASLAGHLEDYMTVNYLRDTAVQAGLDTQYIEVERIGWDARRRRFVDTHGRPIEAIFKLYPWEWMLQEEFGPHLRTAPTRWLEPPWKMLLSNKAILAVLWQLFPDSPYLLPAAFAPEWDDYVIKPIRGREGANVTLVCNQQAVAVTSGPYAAEPCVYQQARLLPSFDGNYPVIGSWLVNGHACGMGIREDRGPITRNTSRFVPHLFRGR